MERVVFLNNNGISIQKRVYTCIVCHTFIFSLFGHVLSIHLAILMFIKQSGRTPLMAASFYGHVDIVRILIEAEAKVDAKDKVCYSYCHNTDCATYFHTEY